MVHVGLNLIHSMVADKRLEILCDSSFLSGFTFAVCLLEFTSNDYHTGHRKF